MNAIRVRWFPTPRLHDFFVRQSQHSFEVVIAFWCVYSGVTSLFNFGIVSNVITNALGTFAAAAFNILFVISGVAIYYGIGRSRGNVEGAGVILLAMSLLVRSLATGWVLGLSPVIFNSYILNGTLIVACMVRLVLLIKVQRELERNGV